MYKIKEIKNSILQGNVFDVIKNIPSNSINTIVTSPPYYNLRDYGEENQIGSEDTLQEYIDKLVIIFSECKRVLKNDGTLWLNLGDGYVNSNGYSRANKQWFRKGRDGAQANNRNANKWAKENKLKIKDLMLVPSRVAIALQEDGWYLRNDIIWYKRNAMPSSVKDRLTNCYEHIFLFSKNSKYYFDSESIKEKCVNGDPNPPRGSRGTKTKNLGLRKQDIVGRADYTGFNSRYTPKEFRNKRDVWDITIKPIKESHFATFPEDLIEPCVLAGSPKNGFVLDLFFGSGTTGRVSKKLGRNYVGIELNKEYVDMATKRIREY